MLHEVSYIIWPRHFRSLNNAGSVNSSATNLRKRVPRCVLLRIMKLESNRTDHCFRDGRYAENVRSSTLSQRIINASYSALATRETRKTEYPLHSSYTPSSTRCGTTARMRNQQQRKHKYACNRTLHHAATLELRKWLLISLHKRGKQVYSVDEIKKRWRRGLVHPIRELCFW
jgi:hypothetical protein